MLYTCLVEKGGCGRKAPAQYFILPADPDSPPELCIICANAREASGVEIPKYEPKPRRLQRRKPSQSRRRTKRMKKEVTANAGSPEATE